MKILLAIDGSPYSDAAVQEICSRPWPAGSEVRVLIVDGPLDNSIRLSASTTVFDELVQQLRCEANRHLQRVTDIIRVEAPQLAISARLREGRPKQEILDEVEQWGADLLVVGSNGYGAVGRFVLGSVSLAVASRAPCNVLIVRSGDLSASGTLEDPT